MKNWLALHEHELPSGFPTAKILNGLNISHNAQQCVHLRQSLLEANKMGLQWERPVPVHM
jgi:hypothetical protein